ncbi:tellurite resistance TerB family protein [Desulfovibrio sp. TomC]|uniref:tellurite resistance TerB family protein n=1 Tax=Desulfovibrio sp. TomC TaxID=1562888 RepID=UPI0009E391FF|nr:TerB family tellurite resistance protein [Desulfovibrio sp. TomC]
MSYWKVLAGVGIGIGAIAAAPFTGGGSVLGGATLIASLTGIGTIAATAGAATAGGLIGYEMGCSDEQKKKSDKETARAEGVKAGETAAAAKYRQKVSDLGERLAKNNAFERKLVGLFAVGMAIANSDGNISNVEIKELDAFVAGISKSALPEHVKNDIEQLRKYPPAFYPAIKKAREYDVTAAEIDEIIQLVALADGVVSQEEKHFIDNWEATKYQFN